jgi:hypothetical protein
MGSTRTGFCDLHRQRVAQAWRPGDQAASGKEKRSLVAALVEWGGYGLDLKRHLDLFCC